MTEENAILDICDGMHLPFELKDLHRVSLKTIVNGKLPREYSIVPFYMYTQFYQIYYGKQK